jgi:hypothetical protein
VKLNDALARLAAGSVALGAVAGSTSALLAVGARADMSVPASLPLSLDGAGLVAALAIRRRGRDPLAWAALAAATGTSAVIQWLTAPDGLPAHLAHVVPPLAVLVSFELFRRATAPHATADVTPDPVQVVAGAPLVSVDAPTKSRATLKQPVDGALTEKSTPVGPEQKEVRAAPAKVAGPRPAPADALALVAPARKILADLDLSPHEIGRPRLVTLMRAGRHPIGTKKADALLALLREEAP